MIKITAIAPYPEFEDLFTDIFEKHNANPYFAGYEIDDYELEIINMPTVTGLSERKFNTDVIVARSGFIHSLRKMKNFIPAVEIPISGNDLSFSLMECKNRFNSKKVAVVGSSNMVFGAEELSKIHGIEVLPYLYTDDTKSANIVDLVLEKGIDTIIGGVRTTEYARSKGANSILIKSGFSSIWQAIAEAKRSAYISRREQEKAQMYKTILDYAYEGIIAIDHNDTISVFNSSAQNTLSAGSKDLAGKKLRSVLEKSGITNLIDTDKKYLNELVKHNDIQLAVNIVPIELKGEQAGKVLTFQDITKIQETESKIRQRIHTRGHIAKYTFESIIGDGKLIRDVIETAKDFAATDSNILIYGKTGTGKELFAQSIHNYSRRKTGPFVAVNCAALPESLLESELFGYVEGAFTGAVKGGKPGLFEIAHGGTIFLDEISETNLKLQGQLLRVLQEKEIRRIGHDRVIPVDVRIITASNKNLESLVHQGFFREDIYYRLNILNLDLPPLKDRKEDIMLLVKSFITEYSKKEGKREIHLTNKAKNILLKWDWPGNIRELKNICERLVVMNKVDIIYEEDVLKVLPGSVLPDSNLSGGPQKKQQQRANPDIGNNSTEQPPFDTVPNDKKGITFLNPYENSQSSSHSGRIYDQDSMGIGSYLDDIKSLEKSKITEALIKNQYNKSKAAKMLGINRTTLWRRIKELGIEDGGANDGG